jgi:AcrR family transcriptional regulator
MKGQGGASRRNRSDNPPAQDKQATKARLLQVATVLFAQKGFHGVSTREITQQARANLSSLYFHWRSKENLYLAAYRDLFQRLVELTQEFFTLLEKGLRTHKSLEQVISPLADLVFDFYEANPELVRLNLHRVLEDGAIAMQVEQEFDNPFYHTLARGYQRLTEAGFIDDYVLLDTISCRREQAGAFARGCRALFLSRVRLGG